ncbi:MAG: LPD38 domain-containing protein [Methylobacter sp.]
MACTYTIEEETLTGQPEFKSWLVDGGLDKLFPDGNYPWGEKSAPDKMEAKAEVKPDGDVKFSKTKPVDLKVKKTVVDENGRHFETGVPVTFYFAHNTESATKLFGLPNKDSPYGRGYEPSGQYLTIIDDQPDKKRQGTIYGSVTFNNPLVIDNNGLNWKQQLSESFGGKVGKKLSQALIDAGYDGVITTDNGYTSETLNLTNFDKSKAKYSKSSQKTGSTVADIITMLPGRVRKLYDSGILNVVQSVDDLPEYLQERGAALYHSAWHGSPHDHDKFDSSKIGTGEGAQAFGYGHYFTEAKDIAEYYRKSLSSQVGLIGVSGKKYGVSQADAEKDAGMLMRMREEDERVFNQYLDDGGSYLGRIAKDIKAGSIKKTSGNLYEVELAPTADEYLDWDKPLSEQSEKVKSAIGRMSERIVQYGSKTTGQTIYQNLANPMLQKKIGILNGQRYQESASNYLHSLGIRGIRYKAEGGKSDANNYVIFDDNDVSITAKYSKDLTGVEALYDEKRDKLYLVADMLNEGNIAAVLNHELYHRAEATDPKLQAAVATFDSRLGNMMKIAEKGQGSPIARAAYDRVINAGTPAKDRLSEFKAYMVTEYSRKPESFTGMVKKSIQDFIAAIRAAMIRAGILPKDLTPADLTALAKYGARVKSHSLDSRSEVNKPAANDGFDNTGMDSWSGSAYDYDDNEGYKVGMTNEKLEALVAQYADTDGKPRREALKEAVDQYRMIEALNFNKDGSPKDGAMLAPNGKPTRLNKAQWIQTRTPNFERWFGKSKVVDENGDPLVVENGQDKLFVNERGQEKSAEFNAGTFNPESGDIRFSKSPPINNVIEQGDDWLKSFLSQARKDAVIYNLQNRFVDLKRQIDKIAKNGGSLTEDNDPYLAEELYHQRSASRIKDFYDHEINPVLRGLHQNKVSIEKFQKFLHARHAPSRNAVMAERNPNQDMIDTNLADAETNLDAVRGNPSATRKEIGDALAEYNKWKRAKPFDGSEEERLSLSGMSDEEAAKFISGLSPVEKLKMDALAKRIDAINNKTLDLLVGYGMETEASVQALKDQWEHYVPLHRDEAHPDDNNFGHPVGRGFSVRGSGMKNATGSTAEVTNILAHITAAREQMLRRGEKNKVTVALADFIKANPDSDFAEINKIDVEKTLNEDGLVDTRMEPLFKRNMADNVVMFRTDGKDRAIVFNKNKIENVRLALSLKNLDGANLDTVESLISKGTRWFSKVNTQYNVIFGIVNLMRDTQAMALNLSSTPLHGKQGEVFRNMGGAFKAIVGVERDMAGIDPSLKAMYDRFNKAGGTTGYAQMFEDIRDRNQALVDELKKLDDPKPMQLAKAFFKLLTDFNTLMENSTRLAVFMTAVESGLSDAKAASLAKNITVNFNRKGARSTKIGAWYAFFNASAQGTARLIETMSGPKGKQILMSGVALGAISTLIGLAVMGDDDWEKIPEFVRERSLIIPIGRSNYISIPMPLGFHLIPNIGRKIVEAAFGSNRVSKTKRFAQLAGSTVGAFNPLGGSDVSEFVMPTILDPALALWRNKDYTGRSIYKEDFNSQRPTPGFTRAKDTASIFSKLAAEGINKITGGTDYKQGFWSPTPDQIDFVLGQLSGGTGRELLKVEETATGLAKSEEVPMYKIPLVGRLAGETSGNAVERAAYYDNIKLLNEHKAEIDGLRKEGNGAEAIRYIKNNPEASLIMKAHATERAVDRLNDRRKLMIKRGLPLSGVEKQIANQMKQLNDAMAERLR